MTTYSRETPCATCGGTEFYKSNMSCVACNKARARAWQQTEAGVSYRREYMRNLRADPQYRLKQKIAAVLRDTGSKA